MFKKIALMSFGVLLAGAWANGIWESGPTIQPVIPHDTVSTITSGYPIQTTWTQSPASPPKVRPVGWIKIQNGGMPPSTAIRSLSNAPADQTTLTRRYTEEAVEVHLNHQKSPSSSISPTVSPTCRCSLRRSIAAKAPAASMVTWLKNWTPLSVRCSKNCAAPGSTKTRWCSSPATTAPWLIQNLAGGSAGLLREGKGSTWEGGMRVPGIAW